MEEIKIIEVKRSVFADNDKDAQEKGTEIRERVCAAEIWCELFGGAQKDMTTHNTKFIHNILKNVEGWKASSSDYGKLRFAIYGAQKGYVRK